MCGTTSCVSSSLGCSLLFAALVFKARTPPTSLFAPSRVAPMQGMARYNGSYGYGRPPGWKK